MKLSTKSQHAVTAMIDLALNDNVRTITLAEISKNQGISLSYLEQLFAKMRKAELVSGVRGPGGGYRLARKPYEITIAQIINSIDEKSKSFPTEPREQPYVSHSMWSILSLKINEFLNQMTLADFTDKRLITQSGNDQSNLNDDSSQTIHINKDSFDGTPKSHSLKSQSDHKVDSETNVSADTRYRRNDFYKT